MSPAETRLALEQEVRETIRTIRLGLDDLSAVLEQLRQLRHDEAHASRDHRLVVEHGPNGRPEVVR
ncbi:hypothetical protein [Luteitalea pratensis]|uniref:hypothetical protein n=1 Tax=Luteitalea pratensis TaxID=1855912 RepID=UPI000D73812C|nr:hypothetical protein [Luteitalea pratensis]